MSLPGILRLAQAYGRRAQEQALSHTAAIQSVTRESNDAGGTTDAWNTTTASVPVRIAPLGNSGAERAAAAGLEATEAFTLTFPHGTVLDETQRIVVGTRTFHVVAVLGPVSYETALRVVAVER